MRLRDGEIRPRNRTYSVGSFVRSQRTGSRSEKSIVPAGGERARPCTLEKIQPDATDSRIKLPSRRPTVTR